MAGFHVTVFDYEGFQAESRTLVSSLEAGDVSPIQDRAFQSAERLSECVQKGGSPPILTHGAPLLSPTKGIRDVKDAPLLEIGYWFLLVLGEYLTSDTLSIWEGNRLLEGTLRSLGWHTEDAKRLVNGFPIHRLINPNLREEAPSLVDERTPYWHWVRIWGADTGWLPKDDVEAFLRKLEKQREKVNDVAVSEFRWVNYGDPVVAREIKNHLTSSFSAFLEKLGQACAEQHGILMTTVRIS